MLYSVLKIVTSVPSPWRIETIHHERRCSFLRCTVENTILTNENREHARAMRTRVCIIKSALRMLFCGHGTKHIERTRVETQTKKTEKRDSLTAGSVSSFLKHPTSCCYPAAPM